MIKTDTAISLTSYTGANPHLDEMVDELDILHNKLYGKAADSHTSLTRYFEQVSMKD